MVAFPLEGASSCLSQPGFSCSRKQGTRGERATESKLARREPFHAWNISNPVWHPQR
jgi:hypothetical protein